MAEPERGIAVAGRNGGSSRGFQVSRIWVFAGLRSMMAKTRVTTPSAENHPVHRCPAMAAKGGVQAALVTLRRVKLTMAAIHPTTAGMRMQSVTTLRTKVKMGKRR